MFDADWQRKCTPGDVRTQKSAPFARAIGQNPAVAEEPEDELERTRVPLIKKLGPGLITGAADD
ncbi:MAG TPA: hypothetical protein VFI80_10135, partial [Burkholderiales bacterium]|nr:hypothetical protein [Burkholderiales bacterium]